MSFRSSPARSGFEIPRFRHIEGGAVQPATPPDRLRDGHGLGPAQVQPAQVQEEAAEVRQVRDSRLGPVRDGADRRRRDGHRVRGPDGQIERGRSAREQVRGDGHREHVPVPYRSRDDHRRHQVRQFGPVHQSQLQRKSC